MVSSVQEYFYGSIFAVCTHVFQIKRSSFTLFKKRYLKDT